MEGREGRREEEREEPGVDAGTGPSKRLGVRKPQEITHASVSLRSGFHGEASRAPVGQSRLVRHQRVSPSGFSAYLCCDALFLSRIHPAEVESCSKGCIPEGPRTCCRL